MREEAMMMLEFMEWQEAADAIKTRDCARDRGQGSNLRFSPFNHWHTAI
ncbi:hypothetical protein IQ249_17480 [Lusitaniella coriacea LEGE 07157]|uniref:Uncharacterized protein n=1 Tax=Lusitaniella coriacea LEGE 07157 TaxID=945747 RepID=A0A8J7DYJ7_9CYAN|nr:hypothetical protein [Lusitaniella coriacea]MBE9117691.1 hypothetical protein [Lusitaniella coriacea LEGE 07157]